MNKKKIIKALAKVLLVATGVMGITMAFCLVMGLQFATEGYTAEIAEGAFILGAGNFIVIALMLASDIIERIYFKDTANN